MFYTIILTLFIVFISILLLGFRIFFFKNGKFPNIHIGGSKAMRKRKIGCATTQDREAQQNFDKKINISHLLNEISDQIN
jgi:hypothetical protein